MFRKAVEQRIRRVTIVGTLALFAQVASATVVEFQTVMGNFEVNLYDNDVPETVANFLDYVNNGRYSNAIIHRSAPGFVIQGGGFTFDRELPLGRVPQFASVVNEPVFSNVHGTISMSKIGGDPDSATSEWFFNLDDNSDNLDSQNGGFSVFGEVIDDGMDVIDAIAALPVFDFGGITNELPLRNYTLDDFANNVPIEEDNLVIITAVIVSDSTVDSAADLNPPLNMAEQAPPPQHGSGGLGSLGWIGLLGLLFAVRRGRTRATP